MSTARKISSISPEAYLEFEESAKEKHEYYNGEVYAMAGTTAEHSLISANIIGELRSGIRGKDCKVYTGDLKVHVQELNAFVYPDALVICGEPDFHQERRHVITNPKLIVEVLSDSTARFDRGIKFSMFRTLPSLEEYVLIDQNFIQVECFNILHNGDWAYRSYFNLDDTVHLRSIDIHIPMRLIYEGLDLPPAPVDDNS